MADVTIKQLLEAGVHFGHQTQRWNPKMKKYIFTERNGIYIINLEITMGCIKKVQAFVRELTGEGKNILFVGTKRQAQDGIREAAESCGMPHVNQRWLGGMLTNFETVRKSLGKLEQIDKLEEDGSFNFMTKKEVGTLKKEREKLTKNLSGIRDMKQVPGAIFVIDAKKEEIAIREARKLGIPVVSVLDTNCDPDCVDYPMPGNDDAIRAIKLFCSVVADAANEGRKGFQKKQEEEKARQEAEAAAAAAEQEKKKAEQEAAAKSEDSKSAVSADKSKSENEAAEPVAEKVPASAKEDASDK